MPALNGSSLTHIFQQNNNKKLTSKTENILQISLSRVKHAKWNKQDTAITSKFKDDVGHRSLDLYNVMNLPKITFLLLGIFVMRTKPTANGAI